ncbi:MULTISPECIES: ribbon-helix-helix domain-containing protein [Nitratireductor]|uniref:ribbon-helix-helix domain-containing protein n=1 Tax=Nitratireductor TaxID=245876 RepID=UPI000D0D8E5F|nr:MULTISPECIES: ribbon-helix-helix domain-containing protein [Nitratireductor]PSM17810.1 aryl-sulfate sulfotransferase [Nitratireductor sp. StC3]
MSGVRKRSVTIRGHRTSYSIEQAFYDELKKIAARRDRALAALVAEIDEQRPRDTNLSSALRLYVLDHVRARDAERARRPEPSS